ncbi:lasso RiPP family leader peptide-containing protein [Streptomyces sp. NRRL B-1677]|uniref:Lasso RiPP family leader peptide-containing protein n=1 Tax=Streptomyces klenkii TaxID=1420899 RepID=A0A3B0BX35_9ACTN|nr:MULTISPECIES: lasso RiPP family leader peptide-containing protein [Streptomyces]MBF6049537.1 lasso RiPP family leader peptide-containing protein [Streptomyces sp. NRRL B-1677]RKN77480.1 lasso RiPP family leader peptide-containing protein [Streptomyces klenkii]
MDQQELYEPPVMVEVGDFADLTRGEALGAHYEGGFPPYEWYLGPS